MELLKHREDDYELKVRERDVDGIIIISAYVPEIDLYLIELVRDKKETYSRVRRMYRTLNESYQAKDNLFEVYIRGILDRR